MIDEHELDKRIETYRDASTRVAPAAGLGARLASGAIARHRESARQSRWSARVALTAFAAAAALAVWSARREAAVEADVLFAAYAAEGTP
jgi:hypothetical protein